MSLSSSWDSAKYRLKSNGFGFLVGQIIMIFISKLLRTHLRPSFEDFQKSRFSQFHTAFDLLQKGLNFPDDEIHKYFQEFQTLLQQLENRMRDTVKLYPRDYGSETESAKVVYFLVRAKKMNSVVETGVANGISTFFILNAMILNGFGKLTSIDISHNVANFLNDNERKYWQLRVLEGKWRKTFCNFIEQVPIIDAFIHDSDHSYPWQLLEYDTALSNLNSKGYILSDDVDCSFAFIDEFSKRSDRASILVQKSRVFGVVQI